MVEYDELRTLTDAELITTYQEYGQIAGDPISDALAAEMEQRNLDT